MTVTLVQTNPQAPAYPELASQPDSESSLLGADTMQMQPSDGIAMLLLMMESASQTSMASARQRIETTRDSLKAELREYLDQIDEALRAARKAKEDDGGWFSDLVGSIVEIVAEIVGPAIENSIELVKCQVDAAVTVATNVVEGRQALDGLQDTAFALVETGQISEDIQGFSRGAAQFAVDLTEFVGKLHVAVTQSALTGESVGALLEDDLDALAESAERNLIDNPHFMAVARALGAAASVAAVAATGGAGAPLAIGLALMALSEFDQRTNLLAEICPEEALPYVRIGIQIAASVCLGVGTKNAPELVKALQLVTGLTTGATDVYAGIRTLVEGNRQADELEHAADMTETLQTMQRLQYLLERLIDTYEQDSEDHARTRELGADLVATETATERALIVPA